MNLYEYNFLIRLFIYFKNVLQFHEIFDDDYLFILQAGQYYKDLTEEEQIICSQTAQFEDFVVEFLDKCFSFIESSSLQQTREEVSLSDHKSR